MVVGIYTTKAMDKHQNHRDNNRVIKKCIGGEYVYLNQIMKVNGSQKYRKITKSLFGSIVMSLKK
jgi:hypothetical protein